jgi:hypothetical protein
MPDASTPVPICVAADASIDGVVWSSLLSTASTDAGGAWDWFNMAAIDAGVGAGPHEVFSGGVFDGHYVYFAGRSAAVMRYDPQNDAGFGSPASWTYFDVATAIHAPGGFEGAIFDGRFVYFIPYGGSPRYTLVARFDTAAPSQSFTDVTAWSTFDLGFLGADAGPDGATATAGFFGGSFDGRYVYLAPHSDGTGTADGWAVRYDTQAPELDAGDDAAEDAGHDGGDAGDAGHDAGDAGDAGQKDAGVDAGDAGEDAEAPDAEAPDAEAPEAGAVAGLGFTNPAAWQTFNVGTVNDAGIGFSGTVFDGKAVYFIPTSNNVYMNEVHGGASGILARYLTDGGFTNHTAWQTFDLTYVNGFAADFVGAAFDGRYIYLVPAGYGVTVRFDTSSAAIDAGAAWESYDITRAVTEDAAARTFQGASFDGRFIYYLPVYTTGKAPFVTVVRYDTQSTFTADCAWSAVDLTQIDAGAPPPPLSGGIFDGQYLYLIPNAGGVVGRFLARTPGAPPGLLGENGSFW